MLERFKKNRGAQVERQAGDWGKIRKAWKQVGREKVSGRKRDVVASRPYSTHKTSPCRPP
ncbi:hypothetical protein CP157_03903 (plasmid) [Paracoccus marcusii]|nr:hypothetical protein CP157_03903 [Paracoccus marcusii]